MDLIVPFLTEEPCPMTKPKQKKLEEKHTILALEGTEAIQTFILRPLSTMHPPRGSQNIAKRAP